MSTVCCNAHGIATSSPMSDFYALALSMSPEPDICRFSCVLMSVTSVRQANNNGLLLANLRCWNRQIKTLEHAMCAHVLQFKASATVFLMIGTPTVTTARNISSACITWRSYEAAPSRRHQVRCTTTLTAKHANILVTWSLLESLSAVSHWRNRLRMHDLLLFRAYFKSQGCYSILTLNFNY